MIRWCSYCQSFLGQSEPFEDYNVSHDICGPCGEHIDDFDPTPGAPLRAFYDDLFTSVRQGRKIEPRSVVETVDRLGVSRGDAYLGILHPLLWRVGREFQRGRLSVAQEHLFSETVESVLEILEFDGERKPCHVLMVLAPQNEHTIGLQIMLRLIDEQTDLIPAWTDAPRASGELSALLSTYNPRIFGVSAALPEQLTYLRSVRDWVEDVPSTLRPHLAVGGPAVVTGSEAIPSEFAVCEPYDVPYGLTQLVSLNDA